MESIRDEAELSETLSDKETPDLFQPKITDHDGVKYTPLKKSISRSSRRSSRKYYNTQNSSMINNENLLNTTVNKKSKFNQNIAENFYYDEIIEHENERPISALMRDISSNKAQFREKQGALHDKRADKISDEILARLKESTFGNLEHSKEFVGNYRFMPKEFVEYERNPKDKHVKGYLRGPEAQIRKPFVDTGIDFELLRTKKYLSELGQNKTTTSKRPNTNPPPTNPREFRELKNKPLSPGKKTKRGSIAQVHGKWDQENGLPSTDNRLSTIKNMQKEELIKKRRLTKLDGSFYTEIVEESMNYNNNCSMNATTRKDSLKIMSTEHQRRLSSMKNKIIGENINPHATNDSWNPSSTRFTQNYPKSHYNNKTIDLNASRTSRELERMSIGSKDRWPIIDEVPSRNISQLLQSKDKWQTGNRFSNLFGEVPPINPVSSNNYVLTSKADSKIDNHNRSYDGFNKQAGSATPIQNQSSIQSNKFPSRFNYTAGVGLRGQSTD